MAISAPFSLKYKSDTSVSNIPMTPLSSRSETMIVRHLDHPKLITNVPEFLPIGDMMKEETRLNYGHALNSESDSFNSSSCSSSISSILDSDVDEDGDSTDGFLLRFPQACQHRESLRTIVNPYNSTKRYSHAPKSSLSNKKRFVPLLPTLDDCPNWRENSPRKKMRKIDFGSLAISSIP